MSGKPRPRPPVVQPEDKSIRYIPITQGKIAIVDADLYEVVAPYSWRLQRSGYARTSRTINGVQVGLSMHGLILGDIPKGMQIDHADGNGLNNRRSNLRVCTSAQNCANRGIVSSSKSPYKGVAFRPTMRDGRRWIARIQTRKNAYFIGGFSTAEDAATAYNIKALEVFGEFARLNFPVG